MHNNVHKIIVTWLNPKLTDNKIWISCKKIKDKFKTTFMKRSEYHTCKNHRSVHLFLNSSIASAQSDFKVMFKAVQFTASFKPSSMASNFS
jgi:hypothetical protein